MMRHLVAALFCTVLAMPAMGAEPERDSRWGTSAAPVPPLKVARPALGNIPAVHVYTNAGYGTGGVGLRNRLGGAINVSAVVKPVKAAFLYWAVITNGAAPAAAKTPKIARRHPLPVSAAVTLNGAVVGTGASPCWGGNTITVLKASVPTSVANGAGVYELVFPAGASGSNGGDDPWYRPGPLPYLEGAGLAIIGGGASTVAVYDVGLAGATFVGPLTYSLPLPAVYTGNVLDWDSIGADGQRGLGREPAAPTSSETTTINGRVVAGGSSAYRDSNWNGGVSGPLPQLWDVTTQALRGVIPSGTSVLNVSVNAPNDCLTPVANLVKVR